MRQEEVGDDKLCRLEALRRGVARPGCHTRKGIYHSQRTSLALRIRKWRGRPWQWRCAMLVAAVSHPRHFLLRARLKIECATRPLADARQAVKPAGLMQELGHSWAKG